VIVEVRVRELAASRSGNAAQQRRQVRQLSLPKHVVEEIAVHAVEREVQNRRFVWGAGRRPCGAFSQLSLVALDDELGDLRSRAAHRDRRDGGERTEREADPKRGRIHCSHRAHL
jgi:hypothetical protein